MADYSPKEAGHGKLIKAAYWPEARDSLDLLGHTQLTSWHHVFVSLHSIFILFNFWDGRKIRRRETALLYHSIVRLSYFLG